MTANKVLNKSFIRSAVRINLFILIWKNYFFNEDLK